MEIKKSPLISIGIASYNYGGYLTKGFDAIKNQKFNDFELIYVDDASTDRSVEIIRGFIKRNPQMRIKLFVNEENKGLIYTKNRLIEEAEGKYLMLCDADDWMAENCLSILSKSVVKDFPDHVSAEVVDITEKGKILQIQNIADNQSKWLWNINHCSLYRKEILDKYHIRIEGYPDDVFLSVSFAQHCYKAIWIKEPLYYWLVHEDSAGRRCLEEEQKNPSTLVKQFIAVVRLIQKVVNEISEEGKEDEDICLLELLLIKIYYLQIFHEAKKFALSEKLECYSLLHQQFLKFNRGYLNNPFLFQKTQMPLRDYAAKIIRLSSFLERIHLFRVALIGYHFFSKFIYFDQ